MPTTTVSIPGMHCEACAKLIQSVNENFPAVRNTIVNLKAKTVTLEHDGSFGFSAWREEVETLGPNYRIHAVSPEQGEMP